MTLYHFIHVAYLLVILIDFGELMVVLVLLGSPMATLGPIFPGLLRVLLLKNL